MADFQSLEVRVNEPSIPTVVEATSTTTGAFVGNFSWGAIDQVLSVTSEPDLVQKLGRPDNQNYKDWFCAKNFLGYSKDLRPVRIAGAGALNAGDVAGYLINNPTTHELDAVNIAASGNSFIARYAGIKGDGIVCDVADASSFAAWAYNGEFDFTPTGDEFFLVVLVNGVVVERHYLSKDPAGVDNFNRNIYAPEVVNRISDYVYLVPEVLITQTANVYDAITGTYTLANGNDGAVPVDGDYTVAWTKHFGNQDTIEVPIAFQGGASTAVGVHMLQIVANARLDMFTFHSPMEADIVGLSDALIESNMITTRNLYGSQGKGAFDGNYKYQRDLYNNTYRWVPLNGDHAGLYARTDKVKGTASAASGHNRGQVNEVTRFAFEPSLPARNRMSNAQINPFAHFGSDGALLYLDKTMITKPSPFDAVGTRRIFNKMETEVSKSARFWLSEYNTSKEQRKFRRTMNMYFSKLIGQGEVVRAEVVCDETTNTPAVVNSKGFAGRLLVETPTSIRGILLDFVSTPNGVAFTEVVG